MGIIVEGVAEDLTVLLPKSEAPQVRRETRPITLTSNMVMLLKGLLLGCSRRHLNRDSPLQVAAPGVQPLKLAGVLRLH